MKKLRIYSSIAVVTCIALLSACGKGAGYKLGEEVTTKNGLHVTVTTIKEIASVAEKNGTSIEPKNDSVFVLVEYSVSNPKAESVEDMAAAGLLDPDKQPPDENVPASMAYEAANPDKYANYSPEKGRIYQAGKMKHSASVYEIAVEDWKKDGWRSRILGDKGFQVFGPVK